MLEVLAVADSARESTVDIGFESQGPQSTTSDIKSHSLTHPSNMFDPMVAKCWTSVADDGPTFSQHRVNVSCLVCKYYLG